MSNHGALVFPFGRFRASFGSGSSTQNDKYPPSEVPVLGQRLNGVVTHVDSPACFYVVLSDDSQRLQDIHRNLQLVAGSFVPASITYKTGMPVAATNNNVWNRAEIAHYEEGSTFAKVFYVDYGETVDQTLDTIHPLPRSLVSTPPLARKCGLVGLKGHIQWTLPESQMFYELVCALDGSAEKVLDVTAVGTNSRNKTAQVELFGDDRRNLNNLFVDSLKASGFADPTLTLSVPFSSRPSFQRPIGSYIAQPCPVDLGVPQNSAIGSFVPQQVDNSCCCWSQIAREQVPMFGTSVGCDLKCNWATKETSTELIYDIVEEPKDKFDFPGFYGVRIFGLANRCWAKDNRRVIITTSWNSKNEIVVVDTENGQITKITNNGNVHGSWIVLDVWENLVLAQCHAPNRPPVLLIAKLPESGREESIVWVRLTNDCTDERLADMQRNILGFRREGKENEAGYVDQQYEGILIQPSGGIDVPLIAFPHLMHAVETVLNMDDNISREKVVFFGGSHGGFLGAHLSAQFPHFYKATVLRNPVLIWPEMGVPCYLGGMCRGLLGRNGKLHIRQNRRDALKEADVVILAGSVCDFRMSYGRVLNRRSKVIAVNRNKEQLFKNTDMFWKPTIAVQGDVGVFMNRLGSLMKSRSYKGCSNEWLESLREKDQTKEAKNEKLAEQKPENHLNPIKVCMDLENSIPDDAILVADGGDFIGTAAYTMRNIAETAKNEQTGFGSSMPQQGPVNSMVPQQTGFGSSMPQQGPVNSMVPQQTGFGSSMPQQGPVNSMVPQQTGFGSSMPQQGPVNSMVPQQAGFGSSMPQQGPVNSMVPQQAGFGSFVPQQGPVNSMLPQQAGFGSFVPQQGIIGSVAQRNLIGSSVTQSRTSGSFMVGQQNASGHNISIETPSRIYTPSPMPDVGNNVQTSSPLNYDKFTQNQLLGQTLKVELSFVNSPEDFYIAIQNSLTGESYGSKLKTTIEVMNEFYQKMPLNAMLLDQVQVGMPCAAAFSVDKRYYRAQVVDCSSPDLITVHFVDFGNTETVPAKFCKQLRPDFIRSCPMLAIKSSLKDAWPIGKQKEWPIEATGIMEDYLEADFSCKFFNVNRKGIYEVELFSLKEKLDLLQILIRRNVADPNLKSQIVPSVAASVTHSIQLQSSLTTQFKRLEFESGQSIGKVTMTVCNGPEDMFIQMDIHKEKVEKISQQCQIETFNVVPLPPRPFPARMACLALFETENTYNRAEVEEDMGSDGVRVYFVDFGNESVCQPSQIRSMPDCPMFRTEALAVNVKLDGIVGKKDENDQFPKPYENVFSNMINSGNCQCNVIRKEPSGKFVIDLRLPNGESVADKLVSSEYAIRQAPYEVCTLISTLAGYKLHLKIDLPDLEIPMILIEDSMDVIVTFIQDAATINVQLSENRDLIADMNNRMHMVYIDALDEQKVLVNPRKGQICAAKYSDGQWYRACVLQRPGPSVVQVYFVDYGNIEIVAKELIKELSQEFLNIAPQALLVHLNGVNNASRSDDRLKTNLQMKEVWIKIESISTSHEGLVVSMSHLLSDGTIININQIASGIARWSEMETSPTPALPQSSQVAGFGNGGGFIGAGTGFDR